MTARLLAGGALAATLALSGCGDGGQDSPSSTAPTVTPTATATSSAPAPSAVAAAKTPKEFVAALTKAMAGQAGVEMVMGGDVLDGSGMVKLDGKPAASYVINVGDTNTLVVVLDGVMYTKDGSDSKARWQARPRSADEQGLDFTPAGTLATMGKGATSVKRVGVEDLQGTPTTKYELTADVPGTSRAKGTKGTVFTIWVDGKDLMRKVAVTEDGSTLTVDYNKWGEPVEVVAPPANEVDTAPGS